MVVLHAGLLRWCYPGPAPTEVNPNVRAPDRQHRQLARPCLFRRGDARRRTRPVRAAAGPVPGTRTRPGTREAGGAAPDVALTTRLHTRPVPRGARPNDREVKSV